MFPGCDFITDKEQDLNVILTQGYIKELGVSLEKIFRLRNGRKKGEWLVMGSNSLWSSISNTATTWKKEAVYPIQLPYFMNTAFVYYFLGCSVPVKTYVFPSICIRLLWFWAREVGIVQQMELATALCICLFLKIRIGTVLQEAKLWLDLSSKSELFFIILISVDSCHFTSQNQWWLVKIISKPVINYQWISNRMFWPVLQKHLLLHI